MTGATNLDTVLGKAVTILRAFRPEDHVVSLAELVRRTGLHKATVHRLAKELVANRLLDRVDDGYRLSGGLFELGMLASLERSLLEMAMPFLQDLYERTHETVHLGVRDGHDVVYVAKIGGHRQANAPSRTGGRIPLHCSAIGKALLANSRVDAETILPESISGPTQNSISDPARLRIELARIREQSIAHDRDETTIGVSCVAAAIGDGKNAVGAISVCGPTKGMNSSALVAPVRMAALATWRHMTSSRTLRPIPA